MPAMEIPWVIDEHTIIKHELLKKYIDPWMAIFFTVQKRYSWPQKVVYFDGFCGPGIYYTDHSKTQKCCGSPLIVAEVANKYIAEDRSRSVIMHCIDKTSECVELLNSNLVRLNQYGQKWVVHHSEFDDKVREVLDEFDQGDLRSQPMFFFIDPFGYSGFPMSTLERIMRYPRAELFINFMVYDIVRFCEEEQSKKNMLALFGSDEFKRVAECSYPEQKYAFFVNLYSNCLKRVGAEFVMPFRINTPNCGTRPRYFLIHASKNKRALEVMKDEMAKLSASPYRFEAVGLITGQMSLFEDPDKGTLRERIFDYIVSAKHGALDFEPLLDWAYANTNGVSKTIKETLIDLEQNQRSIVIERLPGQRRSTVTKGAKIRVNRSSNQ